MPLAVYIPKWCLAKINVSFAYTERAIFDNSDWDVAQFDILPWIFFSNS